MTSIRYAPVTTGTPPLTRLRAATSFGPAFVAAIAYVDPGNFATDFAGGAGTGYRLTWVVLVANLGAQALPDPARLGPRDFSKAGVARHVGPGRDRGDGDRPGRVRRCRDRPQPALPHAD